MDTTGPLRPVSSESTLLFPPAESPIHLLVISSNRLKALNILTPLLSRTPYVLSATLDLSSLGGSYMKSMYPVPRPGSASKRIRSSPSTPKAYQFSPLNLGVVLHALVPRPRGLVTDAGLTEAQLWEVARVWEDYVERHNVEDVVWVKLSDFGSTDSSATPCSEVDDFGNEEDCLECHNDAWKTGLRERYNEFEGDWINSGWNLKVGGWVRERLRLGFGV